MHQPEALLLGALVDFHAARVTCDRFVPAAVGVERGRAPDNAMALLAVIHRRGLVEQPLEGDVSHQTRRESTAMR